MKRVFHLALAALTFSATAFAQVPGEKETATVPPQHINLKDLPKAATIIDDVVVPTPDEVFRVLDKLDKPSWHEVLRPMKDTIKTPNEQPQIALMLGTVIAEGFIAVESENAEQVKTIGKHVRTLAKGISVEKSVIKRANSIVDAADKKDWQMVRKELGGALGDVKTAMKELNNEKLAQLVSLGGWLRGTEALTAVVGKKYTKDGAELLHQPILLDYFDKQLAAMEPKIKRNPIVSKVTKGLVDIRPLITVPDGTEISEKAVKEINLLTESMVKTINEKAR